MIDKEGTTKQIYNDDFVILALKVERIKRASSVELLHERSQQWKADMFLSGGPVLGPYRRRDEAIKAEIDWLERNEYSLNGTS